MWKILWKMEKIIGLLIKGSIRILKSWITTSSITIKIRPENIRRKLKCILLNQCAYSYSHIFLIYDQYFLIIKVISKTFLMTIYHLPLAKLLQTALLVLVQFQSQNWVDAKLVSMGKLSLQTLLVHIFKVLTLLCHNFVTFKLPQSFIA